MDLSTFDKLAHTTLEKIADTLIQTDEDNLCEVDLIEEVLTIEWNDGHQFIVNAHPSTQEIWFASPLTGTHRYYYELSQEEWISEEGRTLLETLQKECEVKGLRIYWE